MTWLLGLLAGLGGLLGLFGPGPVAPPTSPPPSPATLVASWSQSEHDRLGDVDVPPQVIGDDAARGSFLAALPRSVDTAAVEAVDLDTSVIVTGGYPRCTEWSYVVLTATGPVFEVSDGEPNVACGWSPYTVDVWELPRSALNE